MKVLVVVDMQNDFVTGALGTKEACGILPNVVQKMQSFDGMIFATRDTHGEDYPDTLEGKNLPVSHCIKGTSGWALCREVERRLKSCDKPITVAVMGCVVNGPGEASAADVGIAGGKGEGLLFAKGKVLRKVPENQLVDALFEEIDKL